MTQAGTLLAATYFHRWTRLQDVTVIVPSSETRDQGLESVTDALEAGTGDLFDHREDPSREELATVL